MSSRFIAAALVGWLAACQAAFADPMTLDFSWRGSTGCVTLFPNPQFHLRNIPEGARMLSLTLTFAALIVATNVILVLLIIRPVRRLAHVANQVSTGQLEGAELPVRGKDEIAELTASFNRLFTSLAKAMRLLE